MDFSKRQADPRRHFVGFTLVVLFHALIVYASVTGLAKKVVDVVRAPIETKVIEAIKKPPPLYIPPSEVQVAMPPSEIPSVGFTGRASMMASATNKGSAMVDAEALPTTIDGT